VSKSATSISVTSGGSTIVTAEASSAPPITATVAERRTGGGIGEAPA
jgi:hypothetical protein